MFMSCMKTGPILGQHKLSVFNSHLTFVRFLFVSSDATPSLLLASTLKGIKLICTYKVKKCNLYDFGCRERMYICKKKVLVDNKLFL